MGVCKYNTLYQYKVMNKLRIYYLKKYFYYISLIFLSFIIDIPQAYATIDNLFSKVISIKVKQVTLKEALRSIEKETGLTFMYDASSMNLNRIVSLQIDDQSVNSVLKILFKGTDTAWEFNGNQIILASRSSLATNKNTISSKQKQIKGVILDTTGEAIIGANVVIKGLNRGVISGLDGSFTIEATDNDVLQISYIGYIQQDIKIGNKNSFKIVMHEDSQKLDEVVIVGYGSQRKINVTGAISQVDAKELKTAPSGNLSSMLQGRLPGLITKQSSGQPGADGASLAIRGFSTLGYSAPLVIVDGIERAFPNVNPEEIESITVLKDATSAAVYGVRAANGVILVTTKRGTIQKPTVTLNTSASISTNTNFPNFLNGPDYAYWYDKAEELDGIPSDNRRFTRDEIDRITNGDPQGVYGSTDWFDLLFKNYAPTYTNNISLNGGNDNIKYFVSLGAYNQNGIIDRTSYDRYNVRANIDANVIDNFSLSVNIAAEEGKNKEPGLTAGIGNSYSSIFSQAMLVYPFIPAFTSDGKYNGTQNIGNGNQSPLAARDLSGQQITRNSRFEGSITAKYSIPFVKGLDFKVNAAYDKGYSLKKVEFMPFLINVWNQSTRKFGETYGRHALDGEATVEQWFSDIATTTIQSSANYSNKFGKHSVSGLLLYEYASSFGQGMSSGKKKFPILDIPDLSFGEEIESTLIKGGHSSSYRAGYVTRLNYSFDEKYLFEFTGRIDGSPRLPKKNRWGFFPGVALGWRISNESFFKDNVSFIDNLKIRASVGKLGNDAIGDFAYVRTMSLGKDPVVMFGTSLGRPLSVDRVPNENIKWETTTSYNLGLETDMWNGLLGIEADAFYMVTKDILQSQGGLMPPSLGGYFPATLNSGIVDNRGIELVVNHRNKIGQVNYSLRGNVSWARNKIIETTEDPNIPEYRRQTGKPMGQKYGYIAEGIFQTEEEISKSALYGPTLPGDVKLKDLNGDGRITDDQDRTLIGKSNVPEMIFGLNMAANWNGFDVNLFFQGAAMCDVSMCGYYSDRGFSDNTFYTKPFFADGNAPYFLVENSWRPDNTNAKYPRLGVALRSNGTPSSSFWLRNGDYLRLKNAQIGYSIPSGITERLNLEKVRLYVSGSNLFTLDHLEYLDPEMPDVNQGYYPQQRVIEFGLNLTF